MTDITLNVIGVWRTPITTRQDAPKQGREAGVVGKIVLDDCWVEGLTGIKPSSSIWVFSYFHQAKEPVTMVHPRGDMINPATGLFNTRSPNRPTPIGMTLVEVLSVEGKCLTVRGTDALDGTPVVDIKPHIPRLDSACTRS